MTEPTPCRFCGAPAIARFMMPRGCACYPDDREQALCPQHIASAEPVGAMMLADVLDEAGWKFYWTTAIGWRPVTP